MCCSPEISRIEASLRIAGSASNFGIVKSTCQQFFERKLSSAIVKVRDQTQKTPDHRKMVGGFLRLVLGLHQRCKKLNGAWAARAHQAKSLLISLGLLGFSCASPQMGCQFFIRDDLPSILSLIAAILARIDR